MCVCLFRHVGIVFCCFGYTVVPGLFTRVLTRRQRLATSLLLLWQFFFCSCSSGGNSVDEANETHMAPLIKVAESSFHVRTYRGCDLSSLPHAPFTLVSGKKSVR